MTGNDSSNVDWREGIMQRANQLGRYVAGRFLAAAGPGDEAIPAARFLDDDYLEDCMTQAAGAEAAASIAAGHTGPAALEIHAGASRFVRHYAVSLSVPTLIGMAEGVGLDASPAQCTLVMWKGIPYRIMLSGSEVLHCAVRPASWPGGESRAVKSLDEFRAEVGRRLYGEHLAPLIARVAAITGISASLLWTNAAEAVAMISESALEYLGDEAARPYLEDRRALLDADRLPGLDDVENPMEGRMHWIALDRDTYPYGLETRSLCCLTYMLDDRLGRLCSNCPHLPDDEKLALLLERHDAPVGGPSGEAEQKAIQRGLQRPSMRRALRAKESRSIDQPRPDE
ncbi:IucA/IucC family C-terminal-domain containing protein [Kribbella sp. NPDC049227]|uniref:IucA/IucC family C-terminal-domain containing protein n=1 Tax=Kribbella sp. NPDC049227 TaxID=3364113 RepID=UPI00371C3910